MIPNVKSLDKIQKRIHFLKFMRFVRDIHPKIFWALERRLMAIGGFEYTDDEIRIAKKAPWPTSISPYIQWFFMQRLYLQQQESEGHPKTPSIKYEDLVKEPEWHLKAIFKYCGLSENLVPNALKALHKDSQKGSPLAQKTFERNRDDARLGSKATLDVVQELSVEMGFKDAMGDIRLPHDIFGFVNG
jgi:hypothetical protein